LPIQLPLDDELPPPDEVVLDPPPELVDPADDDPEDEPGSRATAVPVAGVSAGRERSCAHAGARLSAKVAAATPIVDL
jgi:hypothetical protein